LIFIKIFRDAVSGFTHLAGAAAAIAGTVFLVANSGGSAEKLTVHLIFGISMVMAFAASTVYHLISKPELLIRVCRIIDHCMIYILIAGTYTPIVFFAFTGALRWGYIFGIWLFAFTGILLKVFFTGRFRLASTIIYLLMGWSIIFAIVPLVKNMSSYGVALLLAGGGFYTAGGAIYMAKKPNLFKNFGFHEIFHIFILFGAAFHYFMVYFYV